MPHLYHFSLDASSRLARILLAELAIEFELEQLHPVVDEERLLALNPSSQVPILEMDETLTLQGCEALVGYCIDQSLPKNNLSLLPDDVVERAEIRRLCDWIAHKLDHESLNIILNEKVTKRLKSKGQPDPSQLRIAKANLSIHCAYFCYLLDQRRWLGGNEIGLADFYLAASVSLFDYLGEINWPDFPELKKWYQAVKSRPSMRPVLKDRWVGMLPVSWYDDLDF